MIWHVLADPDAQFNDLGSGYYESRINRKRKERDLIRQLKHLTGGTVTITVAA